MDLNLIDWVEYSISRTSDGSLHIWVRTVPQIENFIKSLGNGKVDPIGAYGTEWFSLDDNDLTVHRTDKKTISGSTWTLDSVGTSIVSSAEMGVKTNLGFLKLVGIGTPEGVRFGVKGPFGIDFLTRFGREITNEARNFVQEYIVPVNISLKIYSRNG